MGSNGMVVRTRSKGAFWSFLKVARLVVPLIVVGTILLWLGQASAVPTPITNVVIDFIEPSTITVTGTGFSVTPFNLGGEVMGAELLANTGFAFNPFSVRVFKLTEVGGA